MYSLLIFLLPSVLGIKIIDILSKKGKIKDFVIYYLLLVLFSNFICMGAIIILNNFDSNIFLYMTEHLKFSFKYLILSMLVNLILGFIFSIFIKYVSISLEVKNENSKKNIKNN